MNGSTLFVVVAVVAATNPARLVGVLPRPDGVSRVGVAAAGSAIAGLVVLALALAAGGLLDAIDVSAPTMRIGAGLVLIASGFRDLLVGPPAAEPALPGWRASLVPVAIPMLGRPQVGVLAISAGAVEGAGVVAAAMVLVGLCVAGVAWVGSMETSLATRMLRWGAVLAAAITTVIGVAFAVDGVLAV